jgi:quinoprotein glucose dehydrogenase
MLPRSFRSLSRVLASAASVLALVHAPLRLLAAEAEVVEISDPFKGARGHLKPLDRLTTPVIREASADAKDALGHMNVAPGFKIELWAAEPMFANPVAFNLDAQGRVFVAETHRYGSSVLDIRDYMWLLEDDLANRTQDDFLATIRRDFGEDNMKELSKESERLVLLEDTNGDGVADKSSVYADNFRSPIDGIASGVLIRGNDVWFSNIPALWKFTGKDKAETRTELLRGFGVRFNFTGHDFHGLTFGPDGRIYMSIGDRGAYVHTKEGGVVPSSDTGSVFRAWPDGTGFELFATGLRNPQSLLFNEYGDLFTGDNDSDQGDQERLVHVVQDGDSGWRVGYQFAPRGDAGPWNAEKMWHPRNAAQPAFILPAVCNIEDGPSGIAYYPGTGLTPAYQGTIFITHFRGSISNSGIYAYKVKPAGASYAIATAEPFLTGALPTDVRFGPDGKMYYSDWAEGWPKPARGRIYTIFNEDVVNAAETKQVKALIGSDFTKKTDAELGQLLAHPDWRVRLEAQYTLATRGAGGIAQFALALQGPSELAHRHAVWGLGQLAPKESAALGALRPLLQHNDVEVRAQTAKTLGDLRDAVSADALVGALGSSSLRVKFFAAQALGKIKAPAAAPALLAELRANDNQDLYLRHALVMGLVGCATPAELAATAKDESAAIRLGAVLALRRLNDAGVTAFLADADRAIVREAVEAINDAPIPSAYAAIAAFVAKPVDDEPIMLRALNAAFRLGTDDQAAALANFAARPGNPTLRAEALALLALWPQPPARDRIVGVYRPLAEKTRPAETVASALLPKLDELIAAHTPDKVQTAAISAITGLKLRAALPILHAAVADNAQSTSVRVAALKALDGFNDAQLPATVALAGKSDLPELRLAALPISTRLSSSGAVAFLGELLARGTVKEQQAAFTALGTVQDPAADDLIVAQLAKFQAGQVAPGAQLELLDAAALRSDARVKKFLAERDAALAADPDPLAPFRICLEGGDARKGRDTFQWNPIMQCVRCHRFNDEPGGEAGPNLAGIGTRQDREYILESIIKPSAKIAAGFEIVTVTKTNGQAVGGTLVTRDASGVQVKTGENEVTTIAAADIKNVESAPSAMPELAALVLSKAEIRDLVATVASLKTPAKPAKKTLRALQNLEASE